MSNAPRMTNKDLARLLRETATLMELTGANAFKTRAYESAARSIRGYEGDLAEEIRQGDHPDIEGVGKGIWAALREIVLEGAFGKLEELREQVPDGIIEMSKIPGIGPKKLRFFWKEANITSTDELLDAAESGSLNKYKGFGPKTTAEIYNKILYFQKNRGKFHLSDAFAARDTLFDALEEHEDALRFEEVGALRRREPTIEELQILVATAHPQRLLERLDQAGWPLSGEGQGPHAIAITWEEGKAVRLELCEPDEFSNKLAEFTAWGDHLDALHAGLETPKTSEEEVYRAVGLQWVPPELRENMGEVELAREGELPELIDPADVRGIFHAHTTWSDGVHTLEQMAEACREMGYEYLGLTDHSKSAFYANGLDEQRLEQQFAEVDKLNSTLNDFRVFKGVESDILTDGSLDYSDEFLEKFEFVIISIHSNFKMTRDQATKRLVTAIEHPAATILGHPTGRLLLNRKGYDIDHETVIDACAATGTIIEINSNPWRLDLDWTWVPYALEKGVMIALSPDAHSQEGLRDIQYGVMQARKGWVTPTQCLNCFAPDEVLNHLNRKTSAA